jgi:RNA polymerase sigma factor (sigma-70 family)
VDRTGSGLPDDAVVVARIRAGDEAMFARLLDLWSGGMLRVARGYVSTEESAEDVVQDTWLAVIRGIDRFEGRSSLRTWVHRILANLAKTRGVRERRSVPWSALDAGHDGGYDGEPAVAASRFQGPGEAYPGHWRELPASWPRWGSGSPEHEVLAGEVREHLERALADLPERQRVVITLRDVDGCSSDEVCSALSISPANQRVLLHRARAAVRERLERYFGFGGGDPG